MCGIVGAVGRADVGLMLNANDMQRHRGPDQDGVYVDESARVIFGHRRLSIIGLKDGKQPIFNEDRSVALVFNGEIYNYRELREELLRRSHKFTTNTDSEVIVHGYEEFGDALPARLEGMFAFAIWDNKRKKLFCCRDRFGIKPLYFHRHGETLIFASEQKAIIAALGKTPELNPETLLQYFIIGFTTNTQTMFKNICQLAPGHSLIFKDGELKLGSYWKMDCQPLPTSEEDASNILMGKLEDAVESHLVSDVPIGLTLSGGLDSSILAALISKKLKKEGIYDSFHAYTIGYGLESDEIPFAKLVCEKFKINHHVKIVDPLDALEDLPLISWHLEEPLSNVTAITAYQWAKFMSADLKVTLIGEGADEVFGGYLQHRLFSGIIGTMPFPMTKRLYRHAFLQAPLRFLGDLLVGVQMARKRIDEVYHQNFLDAFKQRKSSLKSVLGFDLECQLPNNQLLRIDRMTMAHSLEARVPFLDHRLVEAVRLWPDCWKINGSTQKYILRKSFEKILPKEIIDRPKVGRKGTQSISSIVLSGLEKPLRVIIDEKRFKGLELVNVSLLKDLLDRNRRVSPILGDRVRAKLLYTVFMFLLWHRIFIESNSAKFEKIPLSVFLHV